VRDAGLVVDDARRSGVGNDGEVSFIAFNGEGEDGAELTGAEGRGEAAAGQARAGDGVVIDGVVLEILEDRRVVGVGAVGSGDGRERGIGGEVVVDDPALGREGEAVVGGGVELDFVRGGIGRGLVGLPGDDDLVRGAELTVGAELEVRSECDLLGQSRGSKGKAGDQGEREPRTRGGRRLHRESPFLRLFTWAR
jgi:hypothetical protein